MADARAFWPVGVHLRLVEEREESRNIGPPRVDVDRAPQAVRVPLLEIERAIRPALGRHRRPEKPPVQPAADLEHRITDRSGLKPSRAGVERGDG